MNSRIWSTERCFSLSEDSRRKGSAVIWLSCFNGPCDIAESFSHLDTLGGPNNRNNRVRSHCLQENAFINIGGNNLMKLALPIDTRRDLISSSIDRSHRGRKEKQQGENVKSCLNNTSYIW